jgi:hypothetical protein
MKEFLPKYRESPEFQALMRHLRATYRPIDPPRYNPDGDEMQQWQSIRHAMALQDGFDLLYSILTGDQE